jgi:hypothetical protein
MTRAYPKLKYRLAVSNSISYRPQRRNVSYNKDSCILQSRSVESPFLIKSVDHNGAEHGQPGENLRKGKRTLKQRIRIRGLRLDFRKRCGEHEPGRSRFLIPLFSVIFLVPGTRCRSLTIATFLIWKIFGCIACGSVIEEPMILHM